jgi:apolipoprotein N-acyltransferase
MTLPRRYAPSPGTLASTVCIALAFPPVEWPALIWIGLVPWLFTLERCKTIREAMAQGFWLNFLLGFAGVFWVAYAVPRYLGVSLLGGVLALVLHALVHQLHLTVFAGAYWGRRRAVPPTSFLGLVSLASLYTGIDWATPKLFQDTLGIMLHGNPALRQLAAIGGTPLLTFVVLLVNLGLFALAREISAGLRRTAARGRPMLVRVLWIALPLAGFHLLGTHEYARIGRSIESPERVVRVGLVQGSVTDELKDRWARGDAEAARESLGIYLRATRALFGKGSEPEIVIWPETTYPGVFRKPENDAQLALNVAFDRSIAARGTPLVFGAYDREDRRDRRVLRNALYFVEPGREQARHELSPMQVYHKSILLPIGEYFPLFDEDTVRRWLPHSAHLSRGEGARVYALSLGESEAIQLGPSICYEDLFSSHTAALANMGAQLLVNVSNDSWFGDYGAARLHLIVATLRSVETRLPQVRVTNSGYSGLVLPNGDVLHATRFDREEAKTIPVPIIEPAPTFRMRWGDWFGPASLVLGLVSLRGGRFRRAGPRQQTERGIIIDDGPGPSP